MIVVVILNKSVFNISADVVYKPSVCWGFNLVSNLHKRTVHGFIISNSNLNIEWSSMSMLYQTETHKVEDETWKSGKVMFDRIVICH